MVCCAQYWARHEIDAAGRVGSQLQKLIFFLSALTICSMLALDAMSMMGAGLALIVYAVGLHGAQKRNHKALYFYGAVSLCGVITTLVAVAFVAGFLMFGGMRLHSHVHPDTHWSSPMSAVSEHMKDYAYTTMASKGMVEHMGFVYHDAARAGRRMDDFQFKHHAQVDWSSSSEDSDVSSEQEEDTYNNGDVYDKDRRLIYNNKKSDQEYENIVAVSYKSDKNVTRHQIYHITTFGYVVIAGMIFFALFIFGLKVRTIRLAFQMRRMLLALARQRLPTRATMPSNHTGRTMSPVPAVVRSPSTPAPAPARRRDCARCTYVNVTGAARCAMCDSALPFVAAPANVMAPPRVYTPGSLYPLNQPIN